ncbi:MAG: hypothetical protein P9L94_02490 [Candidatus Hinthialibacter antarcticus]|nr:hypothetical protein [Candidatus Hinthialibacter antarcticus]
MKQIAFIISLLFIVSYLSVCAVEIEYELISKYPDGSAVGYSFPSDISSDGRYVLFYSHENGIVDDDTNREKSVGETFLGPLKFTYGYDQFLYDRESGEIERVSVKEDGSQMLKANALYGQLSPDASAVAYISNVTDAIPSIQNIYLENIYHYDRVKNKLTFTNLYDDNKILSMGYTFKFFNNAKILCRSKDPLIIPESQEFLDWGFFIYDIEKGQLGDYWRNDQGAPLYGRPSEFDISDDGRFIVFTKNITDFKSPIMAYLYDRESREVKLLSADEEGNEANADVRFLTISGDGRYIFFFSNATNISPETVLVFDGKPVTWNLYILDRIEQALEVVPMQNEFGALLNEGWNNVKMTKNGRYLFFARQKNIYRYDRETQKAILVVSHPYMSVSSWFYPSYDGSNVAFSVGYPLVPEDESEISLPATYWGHDVYVATINEESAAANWECY